ncbi:dockerin type I domain-containing protein [Haloarcula sp. S1CR25-12]|uniref:Dockerin type I domain-containing protein n=1 Tax=Haloarcula saliterrae TaxID=2950534 RepID=A0ABU2FHX9_9EURY|nr:dockerin type I domain-containing protein [Haloarcula sp. S1CR25-12]MDS0261851.1 dockerin type I domain-containing protein [Haloarcula sp. S1CR25-12]
MTWNNSTEPNASQIDSLGQRTNPGLPYAVVGNQPTDPNNDSLYEDVNGDGQINIVDSDALQRNLNATAVGANWSAYDFTRDNRTDIGDVLWLFTVTRGVAVNDTDGDGLPNAYEHNWTDTDPAVADTDADGRIDGAEDPDGDGLISYMEYRVGTDPKVTDTDGDGFSDGREDGISGISPTESDTDGDGVPDPVDDLDGDNLSVTNESVYDTSRRLPDTDGDGLQDGSEVHEYGTNATLPDTDSDGIDDGAEIKAGLDPLVADSDGDGIDDTNETVAVTQAHNATNVSLTLRAEGAVANATVDAKPSYFSNSSAHAGPTVRIENRTTFENATIAMPIAESVAADEYENLSIYTWSGSTNDTWKEVETTIENGTAKATVDHFSYFTVLHTEEWVSATSIEVGTPIDFTASDSFQCRNACNLTSNETVVLGGEPSTRKITIEQGNDTYEVVPLSNGQRIENFYNYGNNKVNSALPVFEDDKSQLFFWSGPDGLSLVLLHDHPTTDSVGAVTMAFDGLPIDRGRWVVRDDPPDYVNSTYINWHWNPKRTDGGAFRGGLTNESISIEPAFNDASDVPAGGPGTVDAWQALTGRATDPRNISLAMDKQLTIHVPGDPNENTSSSTNGDAGTVNASYRITEATDSLAVVYQTEQTNINPEATIEITGASGTTVSESLSIGTVGTVQEGVDISTLDTGPANVTLSVDGINMRAQVVRRGSADADGDGIRDSVEEQTWRLPTGSGEQFNLSATDPDTDDDGLTDGEEVAFKPTVIDGELQVEPVEALSNPETPDSDGDGLNDAREIEETEIVIFDTLQKVDALSNATKGEQPPEKGELRKHGSVEYVTSSPWEKDTDSDGLNDSQEWAWRTDPDGRWGDTDGDGVSDEEEIQEGTDPTVHDFRGPNMQRIDWVVSNPTFSRASYSLDFKLRDPSGVSNVSIVYRSGERLDSPPAVGTETFRYKKSGLKPSPGQSVGTLLGGTVVRIKTRDWHGNPSVYRPIERPSVIAQNLEGSLDNINKRQARQFGRAAGYLHGAGEFGYSITNPVETAKAMKNVPKAALNAHETYNSLQRQFDRRRGINNPFKEGTDKHQSYDNGYFDGYMVFFVIEFFSGEVAAKTLRSGGRAGRVANKVSKTRYLGKSVEIARKLQKTTQLPAKAVGRAASWSVKQTKRPFARVALSESRTVSKLVTTRRYISDTIPEGTSSYLDQADEISARYFRDADLSGRTSARVGRAGELMDGNNPRMVSKMLRRMGNSDQQAFLDEGLDLSQRQRLYDTWKNDPSVTAEDIGTVSKRYKQLDEVEADQLDTFIQRQGADGVQLVEEVDSETLSRALSPDCVSPSIGAAPRRPVATARAHSLTAPTVAGPCDEVSHMGYLEEMSEINADADDFDVQQFFKKADDVQDQQLLKQAVVTGEFPLKKLSKQPGEFTDISAKDGTVSYELEGDFGSGSSTVRGDVLYPSDTAEVFGTAAGKSNYGDAVGGEYVNPEKPAKSWEGLDNDGQRAKFVEEKLTPHVLEKRYNLDVICVDTGCGTQNNGIDVMAWDPDNEQLVIVESKWTGNDKSATNVDLGERKGNKVQMTDEWIVDAWDNRGTTNPLDISDSFKHKTEIKRGTGQSSVESAISSRIEANLYDKTYFYSTASRSEKAISTGSSRGYYVDDIFDRVYHFKAGGLTE